MFLGTLNRNNACGVVHELRGRLASAAPTSVAGKASSGPFHAAQAIMRVTTESLDETAPATESNTGRVLVSWLRVDNRDYLAREFGWTRSEAERATDSDYVFAAYDRWGVACADRLVGDFSFALWDPRKQQVFAARDALGIRPFFFVALPELFAFASSAALLTSLPGIEKSVRPEWMARYVHDMSSDWRSTALTAVQKLPPGHFLVANSSEVAVARYHQFRDDAPAEVTRDPAWLDSYRTTLTEAVRCRMRTVAPLGVENSGGIDSATIVALVATIDLDTRRSMHTFGFATHPLEPEFILETSRSFAIVNNHVLCGAPAGPDPRERAWRLLGYPAEHPNSFSFSPIYESARDHSVQTLLSGHGGDETVTNSGAHALQELMAQRRYVQLLRDLPGHPALRPARLARQALRRRKATRSNIASTMLSSLSLTPLRSEVLVEARVAELTEERAAYDTVHRTVNSFVLRDRMNPMLSVRTSECSIVAASYGIDYRWPLLDRRLVQQYLSTPAIWKFGEGYGRYLHRRAITGIVPDKVAWKPSKDMGLDPSYGRRARHPKAPAVPDFRELHPNVRDLVDPVRWQRLRDSPPSPGLLGRPVSRVLDLSRWLYQRADCS